LVAAVLQVQVRVLAMRVGRWAGQGAAPATTTAGSCSTRCPPLASTTTTTPRPDTQLQHHLTPQPPPPLLYQPPPPRIPTELDGRLPYRTRRSLAPNPHSQAKLQPTQATPSPRLERHSRGGAVASGRCCRWWAHSSSSSSSSSRSRQRQQVHCQGMVQHCARRELEPGAQGSQGGNLLPPTATITDCCSCGCCA
jgi:hypothetical protein